MVENSTFRFTRSMAEDRKRTRRQTKLNGKSFDTERARMRGIGWRKGNRVVKSRQRKILFFTVWPGGHWKRHCSTNFKQVWDTLGFGSAWNCKLQAGEGVEGDSVHRPSNALLSATAFNTAWSPDWMKRPQTKAVRKREVCAVPHSLQSLRLGAVLAGLVTLLKSWRNFA